MKINWARPIDELKGLVDSVCEGAWELPWTWPYGRPTKIKQTRFEGSILLTMHARVGDMYKYNLLFLHFFFLSFFPLQETSASLFLSSSSSQP